MNSVELFPSRITGRMVTARAMEEKSLGDGKVIAGGYNPTSDTAVLPLADNAFARTIRLHEAGHAIHSRATKFTVSDLLSQALEDVKVHQHLDTTGSTRRDELYVALNDVRQVAKRVTKSPDRALQGLQLLRAASILRKDGEYNHGTTSTIGTAKLIDTASRYHRQGIELIDSILAEVEAGNMDSARALASKFFTGKDAEESQQESEESNSDGSESESSNESKDGKGQSENESEENESNDSSKGDGDSDSDSDSDKSEDKAKDSKDAKQPAKASSQSNADMSSTPACKPSHKPSLKASTVEPIPAEMAKGSLSDYIPAPIVKAEKIYQLEEGRKDSEDGSITVITGDDGKGLKNEYESKGKAIPYPKLFVHTLSPNASRKVQGKGRNSFKSASQGIKIRTNRLALNSLSPSGSRLFETKHLGGTILIDASGSMNVSDKVLYEIAEKIPAGKVAYYSGVTDGWGERRRNDIDALWMGDLVVYAQNGRIRKDHGEKLPKRHGGNLVDYAAILWLLKQPGPRYLMCDLGFTGTEELAAKAMRLVKTAEKQKKIIRFDNMAKLMEMIRKRN